MEVPAIAAGTLAAIHVQAGEVAPVGAVVAVISAHGETAAAPPPLAPAKAGVQNQEQGPAGAGPRACAGTSGRQRPGPPSRWSRSARCARPSATTARRALPGGTVVTPLARRLAGEAGIDLSNVKGSGPHGRIVAPDVESAKNAKPAPALAQIDGDRDRHADGGCRDRPVARPVRAGKRRAERGQARARRRHRQGLGDGARAHHAGTQPISRVAIGNEPGGRQRRRRQVADRDRSGAARRCASDARARRARSPFPACRVSSSVADMLQSRRRRRCSASARRAAHRSRRRTARSGSSSMMTATLACDHRVRSMRRARRGIACQPSRDLSNSRLR